GNLKLTVANQQPQQVGGQQYFPLGFRPPGPGLDGLNSMGCLPRLYGLNRMQALPEAVEGAGCTEIHINGLPLSAGPQGFAAAAPADVLGNRVDIQSF